MTQNSHGDLAQRMGELITLVLLQGYDVDNGMFIEAPEATANGADIGGWYLTIKRTRKPGGAQ